MLLLGLTGSYDLWSNSRIKARGVGSMKSPYPTSLHLSLLAALSLLWPSAVIGQGEITVHLVDTALTVREGDQFQVRVRTVGTITEEVVVVVAISAEDTSDFIGNSQVGTFLPGGSSEAVTLFTVRDDDVPELEETFTFTLQIVGGNVTIVEPFSAAITVLANDDAYGVFGFVESAVLLTTELGSVTEVSLTVERTQGLYDNVTLLYTVTGDGPTAIPGQDISPSTGSVLFLEDESQKTISFQIMPDDTPEDDEVFRISLSSIHQGAAFGLDTRDVVIQANDAPIRFAKAEYRVDEGPGNKFLELTVFRGVKADGTTLIGPLQGPATVSYELTAGNARFGEDFTGTNGSVGFAVDSTQSTITVQIVEDTTPETEESFQVVLSNPNGDVILATPSLATVVIVSNDDPNGILYLGKRDLEPLETVFVDEDSQRHLNVTVYRNGGTFGNVTVQWLIERDDSDLDPVTSDIGPSRGVLSLADGQSEATIVLSIIQDSVPETAEGYKLQLLSDTITGGARLEGSASLLFVIRDSDFAYGVIGLAPDQQQRLITDTIPRLLELTFDRAGGTLGQVNVTYSVQYNQSLTIMAVLGVSNPLSVTLQAGESRVGVNFTISPSAFLVVDADFTIQILGVALESDAPLGSVNSPVIGSRFITSILVTADAANGEIGFMSIEPIITQEYEGQSNLISLTISREGTNGRAVIQWQLVGVSPTNGSMVTASDTTATTGSVIMDSGMSMSSIIVGILPDDEPETDEVLNVTLTSVEPSETQRLRPGAASVLITVMENDNPGGTFQFSPFLTDSYIAEEEGSPVDLIVVRTGGALLTRKVEYYILPSGEEEFYGAANVLVFEPGEMSTNATIVARGDGIPELDEEFTIYLRSYGDSTAVLGGRTSISITVPANDDPYGVIRFAEKPAVVYINESKGLDVQRARILLERGGGSFGSAMVSWSVEGDTDSDLSPHAGSVTFGPSQTFGYVVLVSNADDIPESEESFTVRLSVPSQTGMTGARLGEPRTATVYIRQNDHPVYFKGPAVIYTEEPSTVHLTIVREGNPDFMAFLKYRTLDGTASHTDNDFLSVVIGDMVFDVGQSERNITLTVLDDDFPENDEEFMVELFDPQGDIVVNGNANTTVVILANDDASGVFQLSPPLSKEMKEGDSVTFDVERLQGSYGAVRVFWEIRDNATDGPVSEGQEFLIRAGSVTFNDLQTLQTVTVTSLSDGLPELSETYKLVLVNITGGIGGQTGQLGDENLEGSILILPNDDPNGLFAIAPESSAVIVAEDYVTGSEDSSKAQIIVERRQGSFGVTEVMWEIVAHSTETDLTTIDLLFVGDIPSTVTEAPDKRRADSGTMAYFFQNSYVSVPAESQPSPGDIRNGFAISAWVIPYSQTNGYIVSKTSPDGLIFYYSLKLLTSVTSTTVEFRHSRQPDVRNQYESGQSSKNIQDGQWHFVVISDGEGLVSFYLDGELLTNKTLGSAVDDAAGQLLVGAPPVGNEQYVGHLQDVLILRRTLTENEVKQRYEQTSQNDVSPMSGVVRFEEGVQRGTVNISSVQDMVPEPEELYSLWLIATKGGARIDLNDSVATVTVLKSDNANGLFGFNGPCISISGDIESTTFACPVERLLGDSGDVTVTWVVVATGGVISSPANGEFENATGAISFDPGQRNQLVNVTALDDLDPELVERFEVILTEAISNDGKLSSTLTSGSSINSSASRTSLEIPENDFPYGLLQFSPLDTPPAVDDPVIRPATSAPEVHILEESGMASLLVVRAQGSVGSISVEWRAEDGTAISTGTTPDYIATAGRLDFTEGQRYAYINITIIDNDVPEDDKTFTVQLLNPSGGAAVGVGSVVTVVIDYSDGAYGVFQFDNDSLVVRAPELGDVGFNSITLQILRLGGTIGATSLTWEVVEDTSNDLVSRGGNVEFVEGQRQSQMEVQIRADTEPELDEAFIIRIVNVTKGDLGEASKLRSTLTIEANDDPYGVFLIPSSERPISVTEGFKNVTVTVRRLYGTRGIVDVDYHTLTPSETYPFIPRGSSRANYSDFIPVNGSIRFSAGQIYRSFTVRILDDDIPEEAESVYARLTNVRLIQGEQSRAVPFSPNLEQDSATFAQLLILSNDNANGILELSPTEVTVLENHTTSVVNVIRRGGTFGEISVKYKITDGTTTKGQDYTELSTDVFLAEGEFEKSLLVEIKDDNIPELAEYFTIELLPGIIGGAVLGNNTVATVTIAPSDDPGGAFGFAIPGLSVSEPLDSQNGEVVVRITRTGGSIGVVTIYWQATFNGSAPISEISPVDGNVFFVSNEGSRDFTLTVLPDDIPEEQEDIRITLTRASEGGRVTSNNVFTLSILPNDNPHGTVAFTEPLYSLEERATDSIQHLTLNRVGGMFGQLRVYYGTGNLDLLTEATQDGSRNVFSYFSVAILGQSQLPDSLVNVSGELRPLESCAGACLVREACAAFQFTVTTTTCLTFVRTDVSSLVASTEDQFYTKDVTESKFLYETSATPDVDYAEVTEAFVTMNAQVAAASIPIKIYNDNTPELDEKFVIRLTRVELVDRPPINEDDTPNLGAQASAQVIITANDNAQGAFSIYSVSPSASPDGSVVIVEEQSQLSVDLIINRGGGSIGEVTVSWFVNTTASTATRAADFLADGAQLRFLDGEERATITVSILNDVIPEDDETIVLQLSEPGGGATITANHTVTIVIQANDNVAGVVGITPISVVAAEGSMVSFNISRSAPALGTVLVVWQVQGVDGSDPTRNFNKYRGFETFLQGDLTRAVHLEVVKDQLPELGEEYELKLINITTQGIRDSGAAIMDPQRSTAAITIQASDDPHGVISFSTASLYMRAQEGETSLQIFVDRKFGSAGTVRVGYQTSGGYLSQTGPQLDLATPVDDFTPVARYIYLEGGVNVGVITLRIINDDIKEIDEAFLVNLTDVSMVGAEDNFPPRLADTQTTAQVIITANDGAQGTFVFAVNSSSVSVDESNRTVSLLVERIGGTFGNVSVRYSPQSRTSNTIAGEDFILTPQYLYFQHGEDSKVIRLRILDDSKAEPDEVVTVVLDSPQGGATVGPPSRALVTIRANDIAGGVVTFDLSDNITLTEPRGVTQMYSIAKFHVRRGPGIYGVVNVPFIVTTTEGQDTADLAPINGYVTFQDRQVSAVLEIRAVQDNLPELTEYFHVTLQPPGGDAKLGEITQRTITIRESDAPYGLLQIYVAGSSNTFMDVEENAALLQFDVVRSQGVLGNISVDVITQSGSASSAGNSTSFTLAPIQTVFSRDVYAWHAFHFFGDTFAIVLTSTSKGPLTSAIGGNGTSPYADSSVLYEWSEGFTPVQSIETDGASSATTFTIGDSTYIAIANVGSSSGRETTSRVYKINANGTLLVVQDLNTVGARHVQFFSQGGKSFLVFANSETSAGLTVLDSTVFVWEDGLGQFSAAPWQMLGTRGARALQTFIIENELYLVVANFYDSITEKFEIDSVIFKLQTNNKFAVYQFIPSQGALDVTHLVIGGEHFLVLANSRLDNTEAGNLTSVVYKWEKTDQNFVGYQDLVTPGVQSLTSFTGPNGNAYVAFANTEGNSTVYVWDVTRLQFVSVWHAPPGRQVATVTVNQPAEQAVLLILTSLSTNSLTNSVSTIYQVSMVKDSDFIPRISTLRFAAGKTTQQTSVVVLEDDIPEDTETFYVALSNPQGGAEIGANQKVSINILSNDDAHGIIEFAEDSLDRREMETPRHDHPIQINVRRYRGYYGRVVVRWSLSGDQSDQDIVPASGLVEFASGQSIATINLVIKDDLIPELPETTYITLQTVVEPGTSLPLKGATIGERNVARLIVQASDSPHGVVYWEHTSVLVTEPKGTDNTQLLNILREQGTLGDIQVYYRTSLAVTLPVNQQAASGQDYVASQTTVVIRDGQTRATVSIQLLRDAIPELAETFLVNITRVELVTGVAETGAGPSVREPGNIVALTVQENDNAKGLILFDVTTNNEGRVDTYEEYGRNKTLALKVSRMIGYFGTVTVTWQAYHRDTSVSDFTPSSGTIRFSPGDTEAFIYIAIVDDNIFEPMEQFDVKLISVSEGASLGAISNVRVAILKNDSPRGLFSFLNTQVPVEESKFIGDPNGRVTVEVIRQVGTEGVVAVQWRLNAEAQRDFDAPRSGILTFQPGEARKSISLTTTRDNLLEGEEKFIVSLTSADDADVSPVRGDATIVISPDPGSSGTVLILPEYRRVYVGEPGESSTAYKGQVEVFVTRGEGVFGGVTVTWSLTPRDVTAFAQLEGSIQFASLQGTVPIVIQARDDTRPELPTLFTLQLTSATGGAVISSEAGSSVAEIVFVASDYPHGLFQFALSEERRVSEDQGSVDVSVTRSYGTIGRVQVRYSTSPGTALEGQDFVPRVGTLMFENGETTQTVRVEVIQDTVPEGPEMFYVNLTNILLLTPSDNNYTLIGGLSQDMRPAIGPADVETIVIEVNDDAEGRIQFDSAAVDFVVREEDGIARLPVQRMLGSYGEVRAAYRAENLTATANVDYVLPAGVVVFGNGMVYNTINISIHDDAERESSEQFRVILTSASGGAQLGDLTTSTVTIAKSDFPNGKFEFNGPINYILANPQQEIQRVLTIGRTEGLLGEQTVYWRIRGPNNPNIVLEDTADIGYRVNGVDTTRGTLRWSNGEGGEKQFTLFVKPRAGWEIEKAFIVEIYQIRGAPSVVGDGEVVPLRAQTTITIQKFGHPNGIIQFGAVAQSPRTIDEPVSSSPFVLRFPVIRRADTGTLGNLLIFWEVSGPIDDTDDVKPTSGSLTLQDGARSREIILQVLPDDVPELTETFQLKLVRVEGGAEVDSIYNTSTFSIRYNDNPHGVFGIRTDDQTVVVDPVTSQRRVQMNITRHEGTFGSVMVPYALQYDQSQSQSGIGVETSTGTVTFQDGQKYLVTTVDIIGDGFLEAGSTFSFSLLKNLQYLGNEITQPPSRKAGETDAKVVVPESAANSQVGLLSQIISVDEATGVAMVTVSRRGTYGTVEVQLKGGYPAGEVPVGFEEGRISPDVTTVNIPQGETQKSVSVQLLGNRAAPELFAVHLPRVPTTAAVGGAKLWSGKTLAQIEPSGVVGFDQNSREITGSELAGELTLTVERLYGSLDKIEVRYEIKGGNASSTTDYRLTSTMVTMETGKTTAEIKIEDSIPERAEDLILTLTRVEKYPTGSLNELSPRISALYHSSHVLIRESNDPYGLLSIDQLSGTVTEADTKVHLTVRRTGGFFGAISVVVRTVGGNEPWSSEIVVQTGTGRADTITQALGNRVAAQAIGARDYEILDTVLYFGDGDAERTVELSLLDDDEAEPAEAVYVYLTRPVGGARIAEGQIDGDRKGYVAVIIDRNDYSNGLIGFAADSLAITVDEDVSSPAIQLKLYRLNAFFGEVQVTWQVKKSVNSDNIEDLQLINQLPEMTGDITCPAGVADCNFNISITDDQTPEEAVSFVVILERVGNDALLDDGRNVANITLLASDYVRGLIQFVPDSSIVNVDKDTKTVRLAVDRTQGRGYRVTVDYSTVQMPSRMTFAGVNLYPAVGPDDFVPLSGRFVFEPNNEDLQYIDVTLTPLLSNSNQYPKQFYVQLSFPTNGSSISEKYGRAVLRIVDESEILIWEAVKTRQLKPFDYNNIVLILSKIKEIVEGEMGENEATLVEDLLSDIVNEGLNSRFPDSTSIKADVFSVLCRLLDPGRSDSRRGHFAYTKLLEMFTYSLLTGEPCPFPAPPELYEYQCQNTRVSVGRWLIQNMTGYSYTAQRDDKFVLPSRFSGTTPTSVGQCVDFSLIEYNSEQWFFEDGQTDTQLLSNRVISFGIKGRESSYSEAPVTFRIHTPNRAIAPRRAQCMYFEESSGTWVSPSGVCEVTGGQQLDVDDYVDCSCKHMTSYAVKAHISDTMGYNVWFYISCFICIIGLALAILCHHICTIAPMFSASLLMHMCFACMATQICYVIAAYFSPTDILVTSLDQDNGRCIAMGLFLHYFFLAQFTWMMTQAINFWKILVMNDEHTDRKYVHFFLLGWASPAIIVAIFYIIVFNVYKYVYEMSYDFIYGDINNNGLMCFITNAFAALGGVIIPVLLMLLLVGVVFIQSYQLTPQWKSYDDVYRGRHNAKEVRILLGFWAVIVLTWLWGGLHLVYGKLWMLVLFCIFNIMQGLYALIVYTVLRNPCLPCARPQKTSYSLNGSPVEGATYPYQSHPASLAPSIKGSRASLLNESWERDSITTSAHMKVKRTLPFNSNIYVTPPVLIQKPNDHDPDFDDLIFALKTGGTFTPSEMSQTLDVDNLSEVSSKRSNFEIRRISIADTHL